jgi:hypothetical protein
VWKPQLGSTDASQLSNWYDQTQGKQGATLPSGTNPVLLDGSVSNSQILSLFPLDVKSLTVQNGYNNTLTIGSGGTVTAYSSSQITSGCTLTIMSSDSHGIELSNNNTVFTVASGGTLKLTDPVGATSDGTYLDRAVGYTGEYLNNAGTVTWNGTAVPFAQQAIIDGIGAPVLNTGTFNLDGGTKGDPTAVGGQLLVSGSDAATNNVGFDMTSGAVNMTNTALLAVTNNYYQSGGSLTTDNSKCTLETGANFNGDINIAGGKVVVDNIPNSVGTLVFRADTVEINGEIDVNGQTQQGGKSTTCDLLDCSQVATVTLQANSFLNVGATGTAPLGTGNQWTVMTYGSIVNSWGKVSVPGTMSASTGPTKVHVTN